MAVTTMEMNATPDAVWRVLSDGWLYPLWVVGTSRIRAVDGSWPEPGARLHHSVGAWPVLTDDSTLVLGAEPLHRLELQARLWPLGEARVVLELRPSSGGTTVSIREDMTEGPGKLLPKPLRSVAFGWRNVETLRRLRMLAEGRP